MSDYFEIDFLDVEAKKSGDAIAIRYEINGTTNIHVVDGGFLDTGDKLTNHINKYYDNPKVINNVVVTHNDGDHAAGLRKILENFEVDALWMLRPWQYADELLPRFSRYTNVENLRKQLRDAYPNLAALEDIALEKEITICEPFQGAQIGAFTVMAPTRSRFLDLVVESDKTPDAAKSDASLAAALGDMFAETFQKMVAFVKAAWGDENFPSEGTSSENEMCVVQYANIAGLKILLTGDTGRSGLQEVIDYAPNVGLTLPGIDRFQVPHHGSRRNVSTELLDKLLGPRLSSAPANGHFSAVVSSAKEDENHPRKAVVRALLHRGANLVTTEGRTIQTSSGNAPERPGWSTVPSEAYPEEQEE